MVSKSRMGVLSKAETLKICLSQKFQNICKSFLKNFIGFPFHDMVSITNSINQFEPEQQINIFPNPVISGKMTIENSTDQIIESIELIDFQGRTVKTIKLNKYKAEIEVSNLEIGMYYVIIHTEKSVLCKKIIVL